MNATITIPDWNGDPIAFVYEFACGIDQKTWYILIGTVVAFAIVRAIINGIKHAVTAVIIALVLFAGSMYSNKIMTDVGLNFKDGVVLINNDSMKATSIKLSNLERITLSKRDGKAVVTFKIKETEDRECVFDESYYPAIRIALKKMHINKIDIE